jgi:hypothetical protein
MFYLKVGDAMDMLECYVSPSLKSRTSQLYGAVKKAPEAARSFVTDIQQMGVMEKTKDVAKALYVRSEVGAANNLLNLFVCKFMFYLKVGDAIVKKAPEAARSVVTDIQQSGVMEKTKDVAKALYVKSEVGANNLLNLFVCNFMFYLKVCDAMLMPESYVPLWLKLRTSQLYGAVKKAPEAARSVVTDIQTIGVMQKTKDVAKALYVKSEVEAKSLYNKYEPVAVELSLSAWYKLRQRPVVAKFIKLLIPPTAYSVQKYNYGAHYLSDGIYRVAAYIPMLIPATTYRVQKYNYGVHYLSDGMYWVAAYIPTLIPPTAYCVQKFNYGVHYLSDGLYRVAAYIPMLIPPTAYCVQQYNYGVHYLFDGLYWVTACIPMDLKENIKNTIYKKLEMKKTSASEIDEASEIQVDDSTEQ